MITKIKETYVSVRKKVNTQVRKVWRLLQWYIIRKPDHLWDKRLQGIIDNVPKEKQQIYKTVLQNQYNLVKHENLAKHGGEYHPGNKPLVDIISITKYVLDNLVLLDIVGCQPMSGPVGLMYTLQFKEEEVEEKEVEETAPGLPTSTKHLSLQVISAVAEARTRKLQTRLPIEPMQDLNSIHGIDIEKEMIQAIATEIVSEITAQHLGCLSDLAQKVETKGTEPEQIVANINKAAADIGFKTRRGSGNFAVMSPVTFARIADFLEDKTEFKKGDKGSVTMGCLLHVGTMNNIKLYVNLFQSDEKILMGYKGNNEIDTGYFYNPYIMIMNSGIVVDPKTFQPVITLMTRYSVYQTPNVEMYYQELTFS